MLLDMSSSPSPKAICPQIQINSPEVMLPQPKSEVLLPQPKSEVQPKSARLPCPCPLPSTFSPCLKKAISDNKLEGNKKLLLIREACEYYYGLCPFPTPKEYEIMAKTLCDTYHQLQNKIPVNGSYWVSSNI